MSGLAGSVAAVLLRWALALSIVVSARPESQYFPDEQLVSDMATLSKGVYHLRNRVSSCRDGQSRNRTLLAAFREETGVRGWWGTRGRAAGAADASADLFHLLLPAGAECLLYYHDATLGTQVLVVRSVRRNYVAVAYAGTDDWRTLTQDGDVLTSTFGPAPAAPDALRRDGDRGAFGAVPEGVRVHRGFNSAVFDRGGWRTVSDCVASARAGGNCEARGRVDLQSVEGVDVETKSSMSAPYRLFTTGHSLGAANSVLLGAALHLTYPQETMRSINFGCPKVGNLQWSSWLDSLQPDRKESDGGSYEIFRFVNKIDLVPRLPLAIFSHVGHTLQITYGGEIEAYYDHQSSQTKFEMVEDNPEPVLLDTVEGNDKEAVSSRA